MIQETNFELLLQAIELSKKCPPSKDAFSVGAILLDATGNKIANGYSRENGPKEHAEEVTLSKATKSGQNTRGGTMFSSLEPCGKRLSGKTSCAELLIAAGVSRVVYALAEPPTFVAPTGDSKLRAAGIEVIILPELDAAAQAINKHLACPNT